MASDLFLGCFVFFLLPKTSPSLISAFGDGVSPSFSGLFPDNVVPLTRLVLTLLLLLLFFSALLRLLVLSCFFFISRTGAHILHLNESVWAERDTAVPSGRRLKEIKNNGGNMSRLSQGWSKESSWAHNVRF